MGAVRLSILRIAFYYLHRKERNHEKFKIATIALRQIQDGGGSRASSKFKMTRVDASAEFKMAVIIFACTGASVNPQDGDHARVLLLVVLRYKIQDRVRLR